MNEILETLARAIRFQMHAARTADLTMQRRINRRVNALEAEAVEALKAQRERAAWCKARAEYLMSGGQPDGDAAVCGLTEMLLEQARKATK
jgi:hypothetical protein